MHRNKLATALAAKLARITWSVLNSTTFDIVRLLTVGYSKFHLP